MQLLKYIKNTIILTLIIILTSCYNLDLSKNLVLNPTEQYDFKSVVDVINREDNSFGNGWVSYNDRKTIGIITNLHVCATNYDDYIVGKGVLPKVLYIRLLNQNNNLIELYSGNPVAVDKFNDICLIKIEQSIDIPQLNTSANAFKCSRTDDLLVASTYPFSLLRSPCISQNGPLNDYSGVHRDSYTLLGSFALGQSGSPVINRKGEVVGMLWGLEMLENGVVFRGSFISSDAINRFIINTLPLLKGN